MFGLNYQGMKKTETYEEVIDYIQNRREDDTPTEQQKDLERVIN